MRIPHRSAALVRHTSRRRTDRLYDILYHQLGQAYSGSTDLEATPFRIYAAEHLKERSPDTEAYWLGQFSALPEPLQPPADHGAEGGASYRAGSVEVRSPQGFAAKLQACCKRYVVTPYVLCWLPIASCSADYWNVTGW